MKQCPHCNRTYIDDTLVFCTSDGNMLVSGASEADEPTVVLNRTPMPPAPAAATTPVPVTHVPPRRKGTPVLKYIAIGLSCFLLLCVGAALALWMMWPRGESSANSQNVATTATPTSAAKAANVQLESTAKPTPKAPESNNSEPAKTRGTPTPDLPQTDPGTSRINFARGRVGQTVQGSIAKERMFVLRTGEGQSLSASVRGASGCVTFGNGSSALNDETEEGDTYVTLVNKCDTPSQFTMSITVR